MKLKSLREEVLNANLELLRRGLVQFTWGNASGLDRRQGILAIKPSGVPYERMKAADLVLVDLEGAIVDGTLRPSTDLPTHLALYRAWPTIGGVAHSHSRAATSWAQAERAIPCFGTTHADYFHGPVPVTARLTARQVRTDCEANTGKTIVRRFAHVDPMRVPAVLVAGHGPFTWGASATEAARHSAVLEEIAVLALQTLAINPKAAALPRAQLDLHFLYKHGPGAGYGQ